jgi:hypothetical protein
MNVILLNYVLILVNVSLQSVFLLKVMAPVLNNYDETSGKQVIMRCRLTLGKVLSKYRFTY